MPSPVAIKICGLTSPGMIDIAAGLRCDYAGLVFFPASPRHVTPEQASALAAHARGKIKTVAVLVDADDALLERIAREVRPDLLQLHGQETPARAGEIRQRLKLPVIRATRVSESDDIAQARRYAGIADLLLFDAKPPKAALPGGNGLSFDWKLLAGREFPCPWFLSGGLNAENVSTAMRQSGARMVDVSSSVENAPGVKCAKLIEEFVTAVRSAEKSL